MSKIVIFYSRKDENYFGGSYRYVEVGNTEIIANMIADITGADMFKIEQKIPYSSNYDTCTAQAKQDLINNVRPALVSIPAKIQDYDEIYLGYPNYWGDMPMAVYSLLENYDWNGKTVHPFCTHEGSGLSSTENKLKKICTGANITKGLAIMGSKVEDSREKVEEWISK